MKRSYPTAGTINRFAKWSLTILKNTFFGVGGITVLVIAALYIAGALVEPLRWYLVGLASALVVLGVGLLAASYIRFILNRLVSGQRMQASDTNKKLWHVNKRVSETGKQVSVIKKASGASEAMLAKTNVGNFPLFQQHKRQLTNEDLKRLNEEWAPKLGLNLDVKALAYIAHRICLCEDTCIGRLAGNIETMLLRVLVARTVKEPDLEVLAIGTLFGTGVAMIHENCRGLFRNIHFTVIEPLIGHTELPNETPLDTTTKAPTTREIFIHNMQRMNIPETDYTIIEKLSTQDEAIEQAAKKHYNLLIIDGDHSDFGVRHDFSNYRHLVKRGGYIIFDGYGSSRWPGLTSFIDNEVARIPGLEFMGTDVCTAVFRVISTED